MQAIRSKREKRKTALRVQLAQGECLKRAAWNVGISYATAKRYRAEA
jgi:hypothetical protein